MNSKAKLDASRIYSRLVHMCILGIYLGLQPSPLFAQDTDHPMSTEVENFGSAEAKMVTRDSGFYPLRQPEVYWHGDDWRIDLLPLTSTNETYKLKISSGSADETRVVPLPDGYGQIRSILRNPDDKAIVIADISGTVASFCIVDLKLGQVIDQVAMYSPSVSPDRRFVTFINGFPPHGSYAEDDYRLYDTFKTPRENTCGFRANDLERRDLDESYRGYEIYPLTPKGNRCLEELPDGENHQRISNFVWSNDSSKVAFADALNGIITLVVARTPSGTADMPQTVVYPLTGLENVCEKECGNSNVRSLAWAGDQIQATLAYTPEAGPVVERELTIPLSKFVPAPH